MDLPYKCTMPRIWAIADLHLALKIPEKAMDYFGPPWEGYVDKIANHWNGLIHKDDLVLLAGDLSWAMRLEDAQADLEWVASLPGTKVLIRGNHDYWWSSLSKLEKVLPSNMHIIQNNSFTWNEIGIGGSRLWDSAEYNFADCIDYKENPRAKKLGEQDNSEEAERIFVRELGRLELSLKSFKNVKTKIVMTHYPPIGRDLKDSRVSELLEKYGVEICVFGHLHNVRQGIEPFFGEKNGVSYHLTSADYLDFKPIEVLKM